MGCRDGRKNGKCCVLCIFFFLLGLEILDLITDWFFYEDVRIAEKGLVFGSVDDLTVKLVFVFTIIGTIASPVEIYTIVKETICIDEYDEGYFLDVLNILVLLVEDIPQAGLLLHVVLCRPEPNSYIQLGKATFSVLTSVMKTGIVIYNQCKKAKKCCKWKKGSVVIFVLTMVELAITFFVFLAAKVEISENGGLRFTLPDSVVEEKYSNGYLADVSIFMHNPNFLFSSPENNNGRCSKWPLTPADLDSPPEFCWLRVASLERVKSLGRLDVRMVFEDNTLSASTQLRMWEREETAKKWTTTGCYRVFENSTVHKYDDGDTNSCQFSSPSALYMTFKYVDTSGDFFKAQLMGDITFNATLLPAGSSGSKIFDLAASDFRDSISSYGKTHIMTSTTTTTTTTTLPRPVILHYYRHQVSDGSGLMHNEANGRPSLFRNNPNVLKDVTNIWTTGWRKCPTTGNVGPTWRGD